MERSDEQLQTPSDPLLPRRQVRLLGLAAVAAVALLLGGVRAGDAIAAGRATVSGTVTTAAAAATPLSVEKGLVDINTTLSAAEGGGQAAGTGMVLTSTGEVLTNNHVVQGSASIQVNLVGDSKTYPATVVGVDPSADVAVLQVQGVSDWQPVTFADSSTLAVGDQVTALGNALGQGGLPSVTTGTITALGQTITAADDLGGSEQLTGLIQTDSSISPGDSGGVLVNGSGQVVGMITAGATQGYRQAASTVGFAIPSDAAETVATQIEAGVAGNGVILGPSPFLGVQVQDVPAAYAAQLGLGSTGGALVVGVVDGSPAAQAGIAPGSVITGVAGTPIASVSDLGPAIDSAQPGDSVVIT